MLAAADANVRCWLLAGCVLTVASAALSGLAPLVLAKAIDLLTGQELKHGGVFLALYLALLGSGRIFDQVQAYAIAVADQRLVRRLGSTTFRHLLGLPLRAHLDRPSGGLIQIQAMMLLGVRLLLAQIIFALAPAVIQLIVILAVVAGAFGAATWLVVTATIALYALAFAWGISGMFRPLRAALDAQAAAAGIRTEAIGAIEAVKAFTAEERIWRRFDGLQRHEERAWRAFHLYRLGTGSAVAIVFASGLAVTLWLGFAGVQEGRVSIGAFVLLNAYMLQIVRPVEMAGFALRDIAQGVAYLARWSEVQGIPSECSGDSCACDPHPAKFDSGPRPPAIDFRHVHFEYERAGPVLSDVTFSVPAGRSVAIVGPSGAGKTTLLRLLQRHYTPSAGTIAFDGVAIESLPLAVVRGQVALVSQDAVLFNDSVRNNLLIGNPEATDQDLEHILREMHLDLGSVDGNALDLMAGEQALKLSGGEKQRLAIARAMLRNAPILVLDEPTSALDAATERVISACLRKAMCNRTTIIITHRLALARIADEIVVLDGGRVAERGSHADLVRNGVLYHELWRHQTTDAGAPGAEAPAVREEGGAMTKR